MFKSPYNTRVFTIFKLASFLSKRAKKFRACLCAEFFTFSLFTSPLFGMRGIFWRAMGKSVELSRRATYPEAQASGSFLSHPPHSRFSSDGELPLCPAGTGKFFCLQYLPCLCRRAHSSKCTMPCTDLNLPLLPPFSSPVGVAVYPMTDIHLYNKM